jgi:hypothetical protein
MNVLTLEKVHRKNHGFSVDRELESHSDLKLHYHINDRSRYANEIEIGFLQLIPS